MLLNPASPRQSAALRQRQVRRRRAASAVALIVLALAILLGLMASKANTPVRHGRRAVGSGRAPAGHSQATQAPAAARPSWGLHPAPASEQVSVRIAGQQLRGGLLFDVWTGAVLWERHPGRALPIASLTKMMTALVVVANSKPSDHVLITTAATHFTGSGVGLLPLNKKVPELALLYGLLLPSGNDAAIALAQHVAGNQARFIRMMNAGAQAMGLGCTHFTTVSGIVDAGNYSCANDLAVMAHAVLEQPLLGRIVASPTAIVPFPIKGGKLYLYNNNPLLITGYPGADGVKTGYTQASGPCLVAAARRGHAWLAVVLLNSANTLEQAERLMNAGFARLRRVRTG